MNTQVPNTKYRRSLRTQYWKAYYQLRRKLFPWFYRERDLAIKKSKPFSGKVTGKYAPGSPSRRGKSLLLLTLRRYYRKLKGQPADLRTLSKTD